MFIISVFRLCGDMPSQLLLFVHSLLLSMLTPLFLPPLSVSLAYFVLAVPICGCLGKHSCMSSQFLILNACSRLQHEMHDVLLTKTLELCWIPSRVDILGNDEADLNAKSASLQAAQPIRLQYIDWYPLLKEKFNEKWMRGWRVKPSKLRELCDTPDIFTNTHMTRRGEIIMDGLQCGHTNLTHGYLMSSNVREPPPGCPACRDSTLTVHHLMFDCAALQRIRRQCFSIYQCRNNPTFVDILGPNTKPNEVILFLNRTLAYDLI